MSAPSHIEVISLFYTPKCQVFFKTIAFLLFGQQLVKKELGQAGLWTLSYLDNDMRVLTARSLDRDTGNLYVLARA